MKKPISATMPAPKRQAGRPRLLTTEQVLDAAIGLGLEGLTMAMLARRLGVSIGMLYGYIANRDELIRLAAARVIQDYAYPRDEGQHWTIYAAENAVAWFKFFTGPGEFLLSYINGQASPATEIDRTREWVAVLNGQGFTPHDALLLQRQLGEMVMGGAVAVAHGRALKERGDPLSVALTARGQIESDEARMLRQAASGHVWQSGAMTLLRAVSAARQEPFDEIAVKRILDLMPDT